MRRRYRRRQWKKFLRLAAVYAAWFAVAGFTMAVFWAGDRFWTASKIFRIKAISFIGELDRPNSDLRRVLTIKEGEHLFGFSSKEATKELKSGFPELNNVEIRRKWNGIIEIAGSIRRPLARLASGEKASGGVPEKIVFVDKDGVRFEWREAGAVGGGELPFLGGGMSPVAEKTVLRFLDVYAASEYRRQMPLDKAWADDFGNVSFTLKAGPRIMWGQVNEAGYPVKIKRLSYVLKQLSGQDLMSFYARFISPERVVVGRNN